MWDIVTRVWTIVLHLYLCFAPSVVLGPFYGRGLGGQGGFVLVTHRGICAGGGHLKV